MHHLNLIFSTAQRLQASRSFLRDLRGLDKTTEGVEFAKAIGQSPVVLTAVTDGLRAQEAQGADKFVEVTLKHYATTKSKVKAMEFAMAEAPEAYSIFRSSGKNIAWPKTA